MQQQNQSDTDQHTGLETLRDIKKIMERSSRFISLSGLSGIAAGICALVGAWFAYDWIHNDYYVAYDSRGTYSGRDFQDLELRLIILAGAVLAAALVTAFYFTWQKAKKDNQPVWNSTSKRLTVNMMIPLLAGGFFILGMLRYDEWRFVAPACLLFYGIALVNASKYTLGEVRWLGYTQIVLGLINMYYVGYGLYFWSAGFGIMHIVYGIIMWVRYEKLPASKGG